MPPRPNAFLQLLLLVFFGLYWFLLCLATCYNIVRHNQETGVDPVSDNPTRDFFSQENGHLIDTITHHLTQRLRRNRLLLELWRFFLQYTLSPEIALQFIPNQSEFVREVTVWMWSPPAGDRLSSGEASGRLHSSSESMSPCGASVENERGRMPNEPGQQPEDKNLHSSSESMSPCGASVENERGRMPNEPGQQPEDKNLHSSSESMSPCGASVENERGRMPNEPGQQPEDKNLHSSSESMSLCGASVRNERGRMPNEPGQQPEDKNLHSSSESMSPCGASVENERGRMPNETEAGASPFCHDNIPKLPKFSGIDLAGSQNNIHRHVTQPSTGHHIYDGGAGNQQPLATQEESVYPTDTMEKENGQRQESPPTIILHRREDDEISIAFQLGNNTLNTLTSEAGQTCIQRSRSCPTRLSHCTEQSLSISKRSKSEHSVEKANGKRLSSIERSNYLTAGDGSNSPCTLRDRQGQKHEQTVMTGLRPYDRGQPHKTGPEGFITSPADRQGQNHEQTVMTGLRPYDRGQPHKTGPEGFITSPADRQGQNHEQTVMTGLRPYDRGQPHKTGPEGFITSPADRQGQNHEQTVMTGLRPYDRGQPHKTGPEGFITSPADRQGQNHEKTVTTGLRPYDRGQPQKTGPEGSLKHKPASSHVMNTRLTEEMSDCWKKETAKSCAAVFRPEQQGMTLEQNHSLVTDDAETQQHNQNATTTGHFGNQKPRAYNRKHSKDRTDSQEEDTAPAEDQDTRPTKN
ncbi:uncharacterized protein LOC125377072 [Haliotis rufescens]|uniref:uncharacterized protein LOC125377072 n=1 Tax=Haliotis rufescens TaxID=6454 RepID=UPI00201F981C|nr:uncharacterized protein LOC125377072 [Haliotis rufescens]XP_048245890.1 uncharacterized protein LOC125377072 [Haliotis rufescens]